LIIRKQTIIASLAALALAACGGGGTASLPASPGASSSNTSASHTSQDATDAATQALSAVVEQYELEDVLDIGIFGQPPSGISVQSVATGAANGHCHNGKEYTKTTVSATETKIELKSFYDIQCTELARDLLSDITQQNSGETIQRADTTYNLTGHLLATRTTTYNVSGKVEHAQAVSIPAGYSATVFSSLTIGTSSHPDTEYGLQYAATAQSANVNTVTGDAGFLDNFGFPTINASLGASGALANTTETFDSSGNVTFDGNLKGTVSGGPLYSLTLTQTPPFTISGGSSLGDVALQGTIAFDPSGTITKLTANGTFLGGNTFAVSSSGSPLSITGTVTSSGGPTLATFQVDQYGDGTITYANGAQGEVIGWHLQA
jgi:hypothetical protein